VSGDRVIRHQALEPCAQNGKRLTQAQGVPQMLAHFKQRLGFMPGSGDGGQEGGAAGRRITYMEAAGRSASPRHLEASRKLLAVNRDGLRKNNLFDLLVMRMENR